AMRAHRLNEKYALKQQKKNNPESFKIDSFLEASSSSINLGDALFSSINTNTAIGGLGGMLFGDEDNGLIEETTSPLLLSESSQGPSIRTWIQVVESNLKDEGSIESKLCDETVSKLVLDDSPEKRLKATWPKKFSFFPAQYVYIMEEILEEERTLIDLKKYGHYLNIPAEGEYVVGEENDGESFDWAGEKYEKSCLPKGEYSGDVRKSVLANDGVSQFDFGMEWGTIMVFTCSKDCNLDEVGEDSVSYYEEL
ncbi:15894_t:CDS:2, partial [Acaulospora colombiana]